MNFNQTKIKLTFLIFISSCSLLFSQTAENYKIKGEIIYGKVFKHTKHLANIVKGPSVGAELAVEWQTMGEQPWHPYFNFPVVGLGLNFLDLGNPQILGQSIALYPYLNVPVVKTEHFNLHTKSGVGMSFITKTFGNAKTYDAAGNLLFDESNTAIGSHLNVFISAGLNMEIPLGRGFSMTADYGWNHVSNGSVIAPNSGLNMLNGYVGLKYSPNYKNTKQPEKKSIPDISKDISIEITASGGIRQRHYTDNKSFPIASLAASVSKPLTNYYRMGAGADVFYDGIFTAGLSPLYNRTFLTSGEFKNKIRVGLSWQNELILGHLTAGIHAGLYLYNPIKNLEPYADAKNGTLTKALIYPYDIEKEDGWFYTRFAGKYMISDHFFIALGLKTHLQKAEFIEWGAGWRF